MDYHQCTASLMMPLPEDVTKRKWAGDFEGAIAAIDSRLQRELPEMLRARLLCERERLLRLPTQYPWGREETIARLQQLAPDATAEDFDRCEEQGLVDFIHINGERRYFVRSHRSLVKNAALLREKGMKPDPSNPYLDSMIAEIKAKGVMARRFTIEASLHMTDSAFRPGRYEAWLPVPQACAQQSEVRLLSDGFDYAADEHAPARTVHMVRTLTENAPFTVRYSYVSRIRYADPLHVPAPAQPLYPDALPVTAADLAEEDPYIRFTPYLRSLEAALSAGCASPVEKAWAYYRFVTEQVTYSFVRDYFQIDDIGEYCAVNLSGDCGLQALCFILLCRIGGIPARWQSGLSIDADSIGHHDWAQFWLEGWGWLFADCSYGGSAFRAGAAERHAFYFGNLDPRRMAANRAFMAAFDPPMQGFRFDPCDNQGGELLYLDRREDEPFLNGRQLDDEARLLADEAVDA